MAVPSKAEQIRRIGDFLSDPRNEERTADELASILVKEFYSMWGRSLEEPPLMPKQGMAFKVPFLPAVHFVAWIGEEFGKEKIWIINATSDFGFMTTRSSDLWRLATASTAKAGAPGSNADEWSAGQVVSLSQRQLWLDVLEVGSKTVLMRSRSDLSLWAESNANMAKFYTKEKK